MRESGRMCSQRRLDQSRLLPLASLRHRPRTQAAVTKKMRVVVMAVTKTLPAVVMAVMKAARAAVTKTARAGSRRKSGSSRGRRPLRP